jgi:hypothetical protein
MGVYKPSSDLPPGAYGPLHVHEEARRRIIADAEDLRHRAEKLGLLGEVAVILSPPKRPQGGQPGAKKPRLAEANEKLWSAYQEERAKTPGATDDEIAGRLVRARRTFGLGKKLKDGRRSILRRLSKIKKDRALADRPRSLLEMAGPKKIGRPKKER